MADYTALLTMLRTAVIPTLSGYEQAAEAIETLLAERDDWHKVADLRAAELVRLGEELDAQPSDARRYRWLRERRWNDAPLCVVRDPKRALTLGSYCPSGFYLDNEIDAAMQENSDEA